MTRATATATLVAAFCFLAGTVLVGWWALPGLALLGGVSRWPRGTGPFPLAMGAAVAWTVLLGWRGLTGPVGTLATRLGVTAGLPGWVLLGVTPVFALGLVWGIATLTPRLGPSS